MRLKSCNLLIIVAVFISRSLGVKIASRYISHESVSRSLIEIETPLSIDISVINVNQIDIVKYVCL